MFPKTGKIFREGNDRGKETKRYAMMIATALRSELGTTHRAAKTVMRWTGASERTVKHWLSGTHGPGGAYLIALMHGSENVFEVVLSAAGRRDALVAAQVLETHSALVEMMAMLEQGRSGQEHSGPVGANRHSRQVGMGSYDLKDDQVNDLENPSSDGEFNLRQRWFLAELASGSDVRAADLLRRWGVSEKTARRDIAMLKSQGMVEFYGPFKTGRYQTIDPTK